MIFKGNKSKNRNNEFHTNDVYEVSIPKCLDTANDKFMANSIENKKIKVKRK